ncbi:MAG: hydrolase [Gammaproteobacteria bacterium]|nr:hydrolase [Gammaproteobacteria bacterium]MDH5582523.1 hydrolase [Gammaproteobacteria bacterium]
MASEKRNKRVMESGFIAPGWLRNAHAQTMLPVLPWAWPSRPKLRRETLELPDGDVTAVDWMVAGDDLPDAAPLLVILHGLEGSAQSSYARMLMDAVLARGWRSCVLHFRDCGDYRNRLPRRYHAGETNDLRHLLNGIQKQRTASGNPGPVLAVGYSLGGNVLLKYLGESKSETPLAAATAICAPLNLHVCAEALNIGFSKVYQSYLLKRMKRSVALKFNQHTAAFNWERAMNASTFAEFDDFVTAPLHGFTGMKDYYDRCSSTHFLGTIERPTLIINALDDPFMSPAVIPDADKLSDDIVLEVSANGGHVGFISGGTPWRPQFYLPGRIIEFLEPFASRPGL